MNMIAQKDRQLGIMFGLAIGDAMGAPIEFTKSREPKDYIRSYITGGFHNVSKGEFTDDTSMALAMAAAFIKAGGFDARLTMNNFLDWKNKGSYSPRGEMFDCGNTVLAALRKYEKNSENPFTGDTSPDAAGNGGLMRLAPALLAARNRTEAITFAKETTRLTHGAEEALFYSTLLALELWDSCPDPNHEDKKLPVEIERSQVMSGGYVKETYQAAWWAYQTTNSFEECVYAAINRGFDADTTGAVAGMIAGNMYGYKSIPKWMVNELQWNEYIADQAQKLIAIGGRETPREELDSMWSSLNKIYAPEAGKVYSINGIQCFCISPLASYGGGSLPLWAVEGHSAQLTLRESMSGYIRGVCLSVSKNPAGFVFKPSSRGWPDQNYQREERFLTTDCIARYDVNWY